MPFNLEGQLPYSIRSCVTVPTEISAQSQWPRKTLSAQKNLIRPEKPYRPRKTLSAQKSLIRSGTFLDLSYSDQISTGTVANASLINLPSTEEVSSQDENYTVLDILIDQSFCIQSQIHLLLN